MIAKVDDPILVTGGTGFLGAYLLRYLIREGFQKIRAIRRPQSSMVLVKDIQHQIEWVEADIEDIIALEDSMEGIKQVYHCAAFVSFDARDYDAMRRVNYIGTANVVNAALQQNVEKLLHTSSIAAIGRTKNEKIITENSKWDNSKLNTNYGISKYLAEQEVWRGKAEGLKVVVVNPSIILGSGIWDKGPLKLFKLVWKNYPFYPDGHSGFVDVRDVARFMVLLMNSEIEGERYILNATHLKFKSLMDLMAEQLDKKGPGIRVSPLMQGILWRIEWLKSRLGGSKPLITKETARQANYSFEYKNEKSIQALDFNYTPIDQTITATSQQFLEAVADGFTPKILPLI